MKNNRYQLSTKHQLLHDTSQSFFQTLHEIIPANTFFVAENKGRLNEILSVWNTDEQIVEDGATLTLHDSSQWGAFHYMGLPIEMKNGRVFGTIGALDRDRAFTKEDAKLLARMASLVSRLIEAEESIFYDELTGVYRRGYLEALFCGLPADISKAVAFLDLDDFKRVNDTYGHEAGDQVLKAVGGILEEVALVHQAMACRYAGDEFVLIFPDFDREQVMEAIEHLTDKLEQPIPVGDRTVAVTASIGICFQANTLQEYIQRADTAMYQIKRDSKHGIKVYAAG